MKKGTISVASVTLGIGFAALVVVTQIQIASTASGIAVDPGVRGGPAGAGTPLAGLSTNEIAYFDVGKDDFEEVEEIDEGLGPRMNLDSCVGCHSQPASGGTRPETTLNSVVLPAPLGPIRPVIVPSRTAMSTPRNTSSP